MSIKEKKAFLRTLEEELSLLMHARENLISFRNKKFKELEDVKSEVNKCENQIFDFALQNESYAEVYKPNKTYTFRYFDKADNVLKEVSIGIEYKNINSKDLKPSFDHSTKEAAE